MVPEYFDEVMAGLRAAGIDVRHIALVASADTVRTRLRTRSGYWLGKLLGREETWAMAQIDRCAAALSTPRFAHQIPTDDIGVDEVVEKIAKHVGIELTAPRMRPARYQLRRARVGFEHVRWMR